MPRKDVVFFLDSALIRSIASIWADKDNRDVIFLDKENFPDNLLLEGIRSALLVVERNNLRGDVLALISMKTGAMKGGFGIIPVRTFEETSNWIKRRFNGSHQERYLSSIAVYNSFDLDAEKTEKEKCTGYRSDLGVFWGHGRHYCAFWGLACTSQFRKNRKCISTMACRSKDFLRVSPKRYNHRHIVLATCRAAHIPLSKAGDTQNISELFLWGKATSVISGHYIREFSYPIMRSVDAVISSKTNGEILYKINRSYNDLDGLPPAFVLYGDPQERLEAEHKNKIKIHSVLKKENKKEFDTSKEKSIGKTVSHFSNCKNDDELQRSFKRLLKLGAETGLLHPDKMFSPRKTYLAELKTCECPYCNQSLLKETYLWYQLRIKNFQIRDYLRCLNCGFRCDYPISEKIPTVLFEVSENSHIKVSIDVEEQNMAGATFNNNHEFGISPAYQCMALNNSDRGEFVFCRESSGLNHTTKLIVLSFSKNGLSWTERPINPSG